MKQLEILVSFDMNTIIRFFIALIFTLFAFLQLNDSNDNVLWILVYLLTSISIIVKNRFKFLTPFILSIAIILFINNINLIFTAECIQDEVFYEMGGILIILFASYFNLRDNNPINEI